MSGTMELEYAGREITLTRWTKSASSPMREFRAVYSGTAEPVPGLTGASAGEALIGAGREIFRRSAFIGQGEAAVTGSAELERRIASVVSTGEEGTSCSEALSRLRAWQNRRRSSRRTGALPELEAELRAQEQLLERVSESSRRREGLSRELELMESAARAEAEREETERRRVRQAAREAVEKAGEDVQRLEAALSAAVAERARREAAEGASPFAGMEPDEALSEAEAAAEKAGELGAAARSGVSRTTAYIFAALCLVAFGLGFVSAWAFIGAALFAGLAAWRLFRRVEGGGARAAGLGGAAQAACVLGSGGRAGAFGRRARVCGAVRRGGKGAGPSCRAGEALEEARARRSEAEARLFEELPPSESRREAERRCELLRASIAELGGAVAAMGDPWCWRAASSKSASIWRGLTGSARP